MAHNQMSCLCLLSTSSSHSHGRLEGIVDPPLQTSKSTNHEDTNTNTLGEKVLGTLLAGNLAEGLSLVASLTHLGNKVVWGLRDDGTDYTGQIPFA